MDKEFNPKILSHDAWWFNCLSMEERNDIYVNEKTKAESIVFGNRWNAWWKGISDIRKCQIRKEYE